MKSKQLAAAVMAVALTAPGIATALEAGDWLVRGRIINVMPNDDSGNVFVAGAPIAGSGVKVDDEFTLDLDFTYMFTKNIGAELLLDLSSQHRASSKGTLAAIAPGKILDARVLPPSLLVQYHFMPDAKFRPYVGAGLNYTMFFDEGATGTGRSVLGLTNVDLDSSFGYALQAGADIEIDKNWFLNFDVKYINIETEATARSTALNAPVKVDVDINPWVVGIGIGRKF